MSWKTQKLSAAEGSCRNGENTSVDPSLHTTADTWNTPLNSVHTITWTSPAFIMQLCGHKMQATIWPQAKMLLVLYSRGKTSAMNCHIKIFLNHLQLVFRLYLLKSPKVFLIFFVVKGDQRCTKIFFIEHKMSRLRMWGLFFKLHETTKQASLAVSLPFSLTPAGNTSDLYYCTSHFQKQMLW